MRTENRDYLLSRTEVEAKFGITKRYLELAIMHGNGPAYVRIGRLVRYRIRDIESWIDANTVEV